MSEAGQHQDLVVLVSDKHMKSTIQALLARHRSLSLRTLTYTVRVHLERDPGCFHRGHDFLRPFASMYHHALVLFDHEGSGRENLTAHACEREVEKRLSDSGWGNRAAAIVIEPELEAWVWSDSPHVAECLGSTLPMNRLRKWVEQRGFWNAGDTKPHRPKEAMEAILRDRGVPHSSAIFRDLASQVSLERCTDASFEKLKRTLREWFPAE